MCVCVWWGVRGSTQVRNMSYKHGLQEHNTAVCGLSFLIKHAELSR